MYPSTDSADMSPQGRFRDWSVSPLRILAYSLVTGVLLSAASLAIDPYRTDWSVTNRLQDRFAPYSRQWVRITPQQLRQQRLLPGWHAARFYGFPLPVAEHYPHIKHRPARIHWRQSIAVVAFWSVAAGIGLISYYVCRTRRRLRHGVCVGCGYDLRGTPGNRCTECGQPFDR